MNLNIFNKEEKQPESFMYTEEQLMARLKFFIGICLALTLFGIVFVVLYSLIFVTQPLNAISPIDQKFFELIIPIAMEKESRFAIREGGHTVGAGVVTEVIA